MRNILYRERERRLLWRRTTVLFILLVAQIFIITMFSSQTGEQSSDVSRSVMDKMEWVPKSIPRENSDGAGELSLHKIIRKLAHFYNFGVIGILLSAIHTGFEESGKRAFLWAVFGLVIGIADEVYQNFVPGRSAAVTDVLIDFSGVLFGMSFMKVFLGIIFAKRCRK